MGINGFRLIALLLLSLALVGCTPPEPIRLGFIGGVSGRVADLGIGGRNGAMLAVEQRNAADGIAGRRIELLVEDDQQDTSAAQAAVTRLIGRRVEAIIGPMTSAMAMATVPIVDRARLLMLSPTVTTSALSGLDDHFMRVIAPTTEYARKSATYHYTNQGSRRVAVAYDLRNAAYSEDWLAAYRAAYEASGGAVASVGTFSSSDETQFEGLAANLLDSHPDNILIIANSVDAAILAQHIRKRDAGVRIATAEWAATERLIELGGKAIEGIVTAQFIDRGSTLPTYLAFRHAYMERFGHEPGFAGLAAYDAANVLLDAYAGKRPDQSLKEAILARRQFSGAQSPIRFDAYGDTQRETYLTTIRDGVFVPLR